MEIWSLKNVEKYIINDYVWRKIPLHSGCYEFHTIIPKEKH